MHHGLGLPADAMIYDVSNACLGLLNGMVQVANMIELGQIRAGVVVGTECGRELVENTIAQLNSDQSLTRESVKNSIASLTIGSASAAIVLCDEELSQTGNRLTTAMVHCDTSQHDLCQSRGLETFMQTDSEELMRRGVAAGAETFERFLAAAGWEPDDIDRTFCHQVGVAHRKLMFESLGLDPAIDFATRRNAGQHGRRGPCPSRWRSASNRAGCERGDRVAMLGIGSGINCLMLAVEWQNSASGEWQAVAAKWRRHRCSAQHAYAADVREQHPAMHATRAISCAARTTSSRMTSTTTTTPPTAAQTDPRWARCWAARSPGGCKRIELSPLGHLALDLLQLRVVQLFFDQRPGFRRAGARPFRCRLTHRSTSARSLVEACLSDSVGASSPVLRLATPSTSSSSSGARPISSSGRPAPLPFWSSRFVSRSETEIVRLLPDGCLAGAAASACRCEKRLNTPLPTPLS